MAEAQLKANSSLTPDDVVDLTAEFRESTIDSCSGNNNAHVKEVTSWLSTDTKPTDGGDLKNNTEENIPGPTRSASGEKVDHDGYKPPISSYSETEGVMQNDISHNEDGESSKPQDPHHSDDGEGDKPKDPDHIEDGEGNTPKGSNHSDDSSLYKPGEPGPTQDGDYHKLEESDHGPDDEKYQPKEFDDDLDDAHDDYKWDDSGKYQGYYGYDPEEDYYAYSSDDCDHRHSEGYYFSASLDDWTTYLVDDPDC